MHLAHVCVGVCVGGYALRGCMLIGVQLSVYFHFQSYRHAKHFILEVMVYYNLEIISFLSNVYILIRVSWHNYITPLSAFTSTVSSPEALQPSLTHTIYTY